MTINEKALKLHEEWNGKLEIVAKSPVKSREDLSLAYTPGVAEPCKVIAQDKEAAYKYTMKANTVAVVSDGSAVLGLGNIGPYAAMPVMEGKAVLYKVFGDVDAVPVCLGTTDTEQLVQTVKYLEPSFAGINLEDIESPKCYEVEARLQEMMDIPVFHDDQHGTAIAAVSAVVGALRLVGKEMAKVRVLVNGAGAAGTAIVRLLLQAGATDVTMLNSKGAMYQGMDKTRVDAMQETLLGRTNKECRQGKLAEVIEGADVLIGVSAPGAFTPELIAKMAKDAIVFSLCNPQPEIGYEEAKAAGVKVVGTGRSDAPNQVNNVSVFPGIFRGAIDVRARRINDAMKLAAVYAIADLVKEEELREDYVVPNAFDKRVAPAVARAVAQAAMETGVARVKMDPAEVERRAAKRIAHGIQ